MADPLVTVIVLAAKREHLLSNTLNSVRAQSYPNVQCIVTGSDKSSIRQMVSDLQGVEWIAENEATDTRLLNRALHQANGTFLAVLETGNLWYPDFLSEQVDLLRQGKADLTIANALEETPGPEPVNLFQVRPSYKRLLRESDQHWIYPAATDLNSLLTGAQLPPPSGFVFRKSLVDTGWDERFNALSHQAAMLTLLKNHTPVIAICRTRLWFKRLDPLTHLQPVEKSIREGMQRIAEAKKLLHHPALSTVQRKILKQGLSRQYRLQALNCRKAGKQTANLNSLLQAVRYQPMVLKQFIRKSKTYILSRI